MNIQEIFTTYGLGTAEFCRMTGIPYQTATQWKLGKKVPPQWETNVVVYWIQHSFEKPSAASEQKNDTENAETIRDIIAKYNLRPVDFCRITETPKCTFDAWKSDLRNPPPWSLKMLDLYISAKLAEKTSAPVSTIPEILSTYSITVADFARITGVQYQTALLWKSGKTCPPEWYIPLIVCFLKNRQNSVRDNYIFADNISQIFTEYDLTTAQLRKFIDIPVRTIEDWKSGKTEPKPFIPKLIDCWLHYHAGLTKQ